jgi:hypothetical protein
MIPKSGDRAGLDASGVATAEFSSGNARDTPLRVGSYRKMARECSFHTVCKNYGRVLSLATGRSARSFSTSRNPDFYDRPFPLALARFPNFLGARRFFLHQINPERPTVALQHPRSDWYKVGVNGPFHFPLSTLKVTATSLSFSAFLSRVDGGNAPQAERDRRPRQLPLRTE